MAAYNFGSMFQKNLQNSIIFVYNETDTQLIWFTLFMFKMPALILEGVHTECEVIIFMMCSLFVRENFHDI